MGNSLLRQVAERIKAALERKEFDVYFQGIVATKTYETIGYEALITYRHC